MFRRTIALALLAAVTTLGSSTALASGYHTPRCYWKTVVTYETVRKPVIDYVTKYTDCGKAYRAKVVRYKTVTVPVEKQVKVCY